MAKYAVSTESVTVAKRWKDVPVLKFAQSSRISIYEKRGSAKQVMKEKKLCLYKVQPIIKSQVKRKFYLQLHSVYLIC
jgi:hypothetical protein